MRRKKRASPEPCAVGSRGSIPPCSTGRRSKTVIAVTQGDCSNTQALTEILDHQGIKIIHFNYPYDRNPDLLKKNMEALMESFGVACRR